MFKSFFAVLVVTVSFLNGTYLCADNRQDPRELLEEPVQELDPVLVHILRAENRVLAAEQDLFRRFEAERQISAQTTALLYSPWVSFFALAGLSLIPAVMRVDSIMDNLFPIAGLFAGAFLMDYLRTQWNPFSQNEDFEYRIAIRDYRITFRVPRFS